MMLTCNTCDMEEGGSIAASPEGEIPITMDVMVVKPSCSQTRQGRLAYHHIPEAHDLTRDDIYEGDDSVVMVFDFDEDQIDTIRHKVLVQIKWGFAFTSIMFWGFAAFSFLGEEDRFTCILGIAIGCCIWLVYYPTRKMVSTMELKPRLAATSKGLKFESGGTDYMLSDTVVVRDYATKIGPKVAS